MVDDGSAIEEERASTEESGERTSRSVLERREKDFINLFLKFVTFYVK